MYRDCSAFLSCAAAMFDTGGAVERRQGQSAAPHACSGLLTLGALARQRRSVALNSNSCRPLFKQFALMRAGINFLAGIIKRRCPTAPYLSDMRREPLVASTERRRWKALSMASAILIGFCLVLGSMLGIYIAPLVIAVVRDHHRLPWIGLLNLAAGWTVAGWIAALVWSVTAIRQPAAIILIGSPALRTPQPAAA